MKNDTERREYRKQFCFEKMTTIDWWRHKQLKLMYDKKYDSSIILPEISSFLSSKKKDRKLPFVDVVWTRMKWLVSLEVYINKIYSHINKIYSHMLFM